MKKGADKDVITGMVTVQKTVKQDKKNYNAIVNRIMNILRKKDHPCTSTELQKEIKDVDFKNKEFLRQLQKYDQKIRYDDKKDMFYLKSKYIMNNIEDLKEKVRVSEMGLMEDEELTDSYPGIKGDLEKLKRENYVKCVYNSEKQCNVLFYRDLGDKYEKLIIDQEYMEALNELRKIWKDELTYYDTSEKNQYIAKKRLRSEPIQKRGEKRRRTKNWQNVHVEHLLSNLEATG